MAEPSVLTADRLREILHYNPESGEFRWSPFTNGHHDKNKPAGSFHKGYHRICVDGRRYLSHRLAWLYMTGEWPALEIDHINRNKSDNTWSNLRLVTHSQNCWNHEMRRSNTSGTNGVQSVSWGKRKWRVQLGGVTYGYFATKTEAEEVALRVFNTKRP